MLDRVLRFRRGSVITALLVATGLAASCGPGAPPVVNVCPDDGPGACPENAPSYIADVAPLLRQRCGACHTAGGVSAVHPLDTHAQVKALLIGIQAQLQSCLMPPADQTQPTAAERRTIFSWIACGAREN